MYQQITVTTSTTRIATTATKNATELLSTDIS